MTEITPNIASIKARIPYQIIEHLLIKGKLANYSLFGMRLIDLNELIGLKVEMMEGCDYDL